MIGFMHNYDTGEAEPVLAGCLAGEDLTRFIPREGGARDDYKALVKHGSDSLTAAIVCLSISALGYYDEDLARIERYYENRYAPRSEIMFAGQ